MSLLSKVFMIFFLGLIAYALGSALYFLVHDQPNSKQLVKALTWRIGLSLFLFLGLMLAYALGWLQPHY